MSEQTMAMHAARSSASQAKLDRVVAVTRAMLERGEEPVKAEIARRAGVSRKFCYSPAAAAAIARELETAAERFAASQISSARVSSASLRADLENYRAQNRRLREQIRTLERRLSEALGAEVVTALPADELPEAEDAERARERAEAAEQRVFELESELADRDEELTAVRQINRELVSQQNRAEDD